jgi:D-alanyl-D-alanine dipeptidase
MRLAMVMMVAAVGGCAKPAPRAEPGADVRVPDVASVVADAAISIPSDAAIDAAPDAAPDAAVVRDDGPPDELVDVAARIPDLVVDMRYATADNFTGVQLYPVARCLLRRAVAQKLAVAATALRARQRRLVVWDCYRPASIQLLLWKQVPDPRYVARPKFRNGVPVSGSVHSRGAAVDVGLADASGALVPLPTKHDDFSAAAHRDHPAKDPVARAEAATLDEAMIAAGFVGMPTEWWHYDAAGGTRYPLLDIALDAVP